MDGITFVPPPEGHHYECSRCGACCRWEGYVRLDQQEVDEIAEYLGLSVEEFVERYTRLTEDRRSLTLVERADGGCIMLTVGNRCRINPVKPTQCAGFPNTWNFPGWDNLCQAKLVPDEE